MHRKAVSSYYKGLLEKEEFNDESVTISEIGVSVHAFVNEIVRPSSAKYSVSIFGTCENFFSSCATSYICTENPINPVHLGDCGR